MGKKTWRKQQLPTEVELALKSIATCRSVDSLLPQLVDFADNCNLIVNSTINSSSLAPQSNTMVPVDDNAQRDAIALIQNKFDNDTKARFKQIDNKFTADNFKALYIAIENLLTQATKDNNARVIQILKKMQSGIFYVYELEGNSLIVEDAEKEENSTISTLAQEMELDINNYVNSVSAEVNFQPNEADALSFLESSDVKDDTNPIATDSIASSSELLLKSILKDKASKRKKLEVTFATTIETPKKTPYSLLSILNKLAELNRADVNLNRDAIIDTLKYFNSVFIIHAKLIKREAAKRVSIEQLEEILKKPALLEPMQQEDPLASDEQKVENIIINSLQEKIATARGIYPSKRKPEIIALSNNFEMLINNVFSKIDNQHFSSVDKELIGGGILPDQISALKFDIIYDAIAAAKIRYEEISKLKTEFATYKFLSSNLENALKKCLLEASETNQKAYKEALEKVNVKKRQIKDLITSNTTVKTTTLQDCFKGEEKGEENGEEFDSLSFTKIINHYTKTEEEWQKTLADDPNRLFSPPSYAVFPSETQKFSSFDDKAKNKRFNEFADFWSKREAEIYFPPVNTALVDKIKAELPFFLRRRHWSKLCNKLFAVPRNLVDRYSECQKAHDFITTKLPVIESEIEKAKVAVEDIKIKQLRVLKPELNSLDTDSEEVKFAKASAFSKEVNNYQINEQMLNQEDLKRMQSATEVLAAAGDFAGHQVTLNFIGGHLQAVLPKIKQEKEAQAPKLKTWQKVAIGAGIVTGLALICGPLFWGVAVAGVMSVGAAVATGVTLAALGGLFGVLGGSIAASDKKKTPPESHPKPPIEPHQEPKPDDGDPALPKVKVSAQDRKILGSVKQEQREKISVEEQQARDAMKQDEDSRPSVSSGIKLQPKLEPKPTPSPAPTAAAEAAQLTYNNRPKDELPKWNKKPNKKSSTVKSIQKSGGSPIVPDTMNTGLTAEASKAIRENPDINFGASFTAAK